MRSDYQQILLILSGVIVSALLGVFFYREIFPEYRIYQDDYLALEEFHSTYTHQPVPYFQVGVKQIVIEDEHNGPPVIDRCTSCHVALEIPYFSSTKLAKDLNGNVVLDDKGYPLKIPNDDYIWKKLDEKITELRDEKVITQLRENNDFEEVWMREALADKYSALKTAKVGDMTYDVSKVLVMHPLMGKETRPFEFHPVEEYGCTKCHNGNGRGLVTDKAHGPVFDGQYDIEYLGPSPHFTEVDSANDPKFSKVFNHKPGHELLFQTSPIFVGALIQAKCMGCHQTSSADLFNTSSTTESLSMQRQGQMEKLAIAGQTEKQSSDVDELTRNYQRGEELYLSQACYACHRIAGFARGGIGPELTSIGKSYPWYIKESIVWPQADLKTSTMPNMRMDHKELENLMTFLLAQDGVNQAVSQTAYKAAIQSWEAGRKMPWEKPIAPAQIYDLRHSMTIFATEGCASCHRLQGFDSNVGFAVEMQSHTFDQLYEEKMWFKKLFPEVIHYVEYDQELPGSEIVAKIDRHADEIDRRIAPNVKNDGILEEIDQQFPEVIESFYSPFRYASRAKNHHYQSLIDEEKDPAKIAALQKEWQAWKDRVHRVLMTYIQTYGLGRLIGPHLNWTGIYRTDEWLMEHFHNPSGHVPRSLMPAFPFDDSKFYALTFMLDKLAVRNRNAIREIWDQRGFDAKQAYEMLCSQCHGIEMFGNGVIAEWLYPIPKNLRNAEFLRNLTKDRVIFSITHGVKGTPMPPWGEFAEHKVSQIAAISQGVPVLKEEEIRFLSDWLFSTLPGGEVIKRSEVLKWKYTPEDVIQELKKEREQIQPPPQRDVTKDKAQEVSSAWANLNRSYAGFSPISKREETEELTVEDLFDVIPNPTDTHEKGYYIKKRYYTPRNIEAGKEFFLVNCAICHGNEGEGSGKRSEVMQGAKPRMLTNLDWIQSRDDLRLLRSIKYGVPGTAMTPWGDFTSSLQRLQLVIFIRSLSEEHERREKLSQALYQAFDVPQVIVESARVQRSLELQSLNAELKQLQEKEDSLVQAAVQTGQPLKESLQVYQQKLLLMQQKEQLEQQDQKFLAIKQSLVKEREIYFNLGSALINKQVEDKILDDYVQMIQLNENRFSFDNGALTFHQTEAVNHQIVALREEIVAVFDQQIAELIRSRKILEGKIASEKRREEMANLQNAIDSLSNLKAKLIAETQEALRLSKQESDIVAKL